MPGYSWRPIEPLSDADRRIDLADMGSLYASWRVCKKRIQESSPTQLAEFNQRLVRQLSVETGILERLYDLDRGTTEVLVTHGFAEEFIGRSSPDTEPALVIDILRDQQAAIDLVIDCIGKRRELTPGLVHELHSILTSHQWTTAAVDQFGNRREIPLLKGEYKQQPNNPKRPDGSIHEYCPPVHVASEIESLLKWTAEYAEEDPVIVAAWMHHRFTQIHPYQDGNGRLARALTTMVLVRAGLLPLVIDRDMRVEYIGALETADGGDLGPLARIFAKLERHAILQVLSIGPDTETGASGTLTEAVIDSIADKLAKRREEKSASLRAVNGVARALRDHAAASLERSYQGFENKVGSQARRSIQVGGTDHGNAHRYKFQVVSSAKDAGKVANFSEDHYFVKASIRVGRERLVFITSFHHVGRELTGIMEATAFAILESNQGSEERESVAEKFFLCSIEPFVFAHQSEAKRIQDAFVRWLDHALAVAIKEYGDRL